MDQVDRSKHLNFIRRATQGHAADTNLEKAWRTLHKPDGTKRDVLQDEEYTGGYRVDAPSNSVDDLLIFNEITECPNCQSE